MECDKGLDVAFATKGKLAVADRQKNLCFSGGWRIPAGLARGLLMSR
jgi:hypothetical protein